MMELRDLMGIEIYESYLMAFLGRLIQLFLVHGTGTRRRSVSGAHALKGLW